MPISRMYRKTVLTTYFKEVDAIPPATHADNIHWAETKNYQALAKANLRFVISVATEYQGRGLPMEDLIAEGNVGLVKAVKRFDSSRGFRFVTYAVWWIRQAIMEALNDTSRIVRLPVNRVKELNRIIRFTEDYAKTTGCEPHINEIAEAVEQSTQEVELLLRTSQVHLSLDAPLVDTDTAILADVSMEASEGPEAEENAEMDDMQTKIREVFQCLSVREVDVLEKRFGLDGNGGMTLEAIAQVYEMTKERVRQIEKGALEKLRKPQRAKMLAELV